jgi:hypothetical protein
MIEQLSNQQGTGEITLFFPTGSHELRQGSEQDTRLITFLDYLSRESRERAAAPEPIIDQYLVNIPHQFFKVYGLGDTYVPKTTTLTQEQRYQNVRIIAVYQTDQVPVLPTAPKS